MTRGRATADGLTSDPTMAGTVTDASTIAHFRAGFDATPPASFVDVLADLGAGGHFLFDRARLDAISGGSLTQRPACAASAGRGSAWKSLVGLRRQFRAGYDRAGRDNHRAGPRRARKS